MIRASIIITYRESGDKRRENFCAVLRWLGAHDDLEVIVVEQDRIPRLPDAVPDTAAPLSCMRIFAYNPGPFNKSWGCNIGARAARAPILAFADADVIAGGDLHEAIDLCAGGYQAVKPYRRLFDLDEADSVRVRNGDYTFMPGRGVPAAGAREADGEFLTFCGGLFFLRREGFARMGGWDERFLGWGGEDDAMTYKLERLRLSAVELDAHPALHLWHPRTPEATSGQPHYASNCALLAGYPALDDAAFARLGEVQLALMGHRDKHRPPT